MKTFIRLSLFTFLLAFTFVFAHSDGASAQAVRINAGAPVSSIAFSPDGKTLTSSQTDGSVKIWDVKTQALLKTIKGGPNQLLSPDGHYLAIENSFASQDVVTIRDLRAQKNVKTLTGENSAILGIAFSPDGKLFAIANEWDSVRVFASNSGKLIKRISQKGFGGPVVNVAISHDEQLIAGGCADGIIKIWRLKEMGAETLKPDSNHDFIQNCGLAFSPNGRILASGGRNGDITLWSVKTAKVLRGLAGDGTLIAPIAFSPNGKYLACGGSDNATRIWNVETGALSATLTTRIGSITEVAFFPDGRGAAIASASGEIDLLLCSQLSSTE